MTDFTDDILDPHAAVLSALLEVARAAHRMVDDADVDVVATATVPGDLDALCAALDRLGEVATDAPVGYAPHPAENAAHMLRHLVNPDDLSCDACGGAIDGEPLHFSGRLGGAETGHIHLCARCADPLPRIVVQGGVARPDSTQCPDRPPTEADSDCDGFVLALRPISNGFRWEQVRWQAAATLGMQWMLLPPVRVSKS